MNLAMWLKKTQNVMVTPLGMQLQQIRPRIRCKDGFSLSVQASRSSYCEPRTCEPVWTKVEVGYPSAEEPLLNSYSESFGEGNPTEDIYPYVPVEVVEAVIEKHGGIID